MFSLIRNLRDRSIDHLREWLNAADNRTWNKKREQLVNDLAACGKDFRIMGPFALHAPSMIEIGNNVHIGENSFIRGEGGLTIGDNTVISRNLVLYTINHRYEGTRLPYDQELEHQPVVIGRNVWIGMNVCIAPGTTIGDGAIIALGAVVSGIINPGEIVGAQRFRVLKNRNREHYQQLDEQRLYADPWGRPLE